MLRFVNETVEGLLMGRNVDNAMFIGRIAVDRGKASSKLFKDMQASSIRVPRRTSLLFDSLVVMAWLSENTDGGKTLTFVLKEIFLTGSMFPTFDGSGVRTSARGSNLLYAIMQGLKLGIIMQNESAAGDGITLQLAVDQPFPDTTMVYLVGAEDVPKVFGEMDGSFKHAYVDKCKWTLEKNENGMWYWNMDVACAFQENPTNKDRQFIASVHEKAVSETNGRNKTSQHPKLISTLETKRIALFDADGFLGQCVAARIQSLLHHGIIDNLLQSGFPSRNMSLLGKDMESFMGSDSALMQAVFYSLACATKIHKRGEVPDFPSNHEDPENPLQLSKRHASFHITMTVNKAFQYMDLLPVVMAHVIDATSPEQAERWGGDLLVSSIAVTVTNSLVKGDRERSVTMKHKSLLYSNSDQDAVTGLQQQCLRCMKFL